MFDLDNTVSTTQAARLIGCSTARLRQMLGDEAIPGARKLPTGAWLLPLAEVQKIARTEHRRGGPRGPRQKNAG